MAASTSYDQSPSSSTSPPTSWDVFLSFRGEDTRNSFTSHLYKDLCRDGIKTFMDNPELRSGDVISDSLIQAIQESKTYIVVLSENYASSSWCLDELVEILHCHNTLKRLVVPVFYYIDPSVVRHQIGSFKEAFDKHQTRYDVEKLTNWRLTLKEVADFSGYLIFKDKSEAETIDEVVSRISLQTNPRTLHVAAFKVGLDSRVKSVTTLINSGTNGVIRIGIHGMGGVGKTTLAKEVYNQNYQRFQGSCFLANVREVSGRSDGIESLQKQLINNVLKRKDITIDNADQGIECIKARICSKKVLVVIDDLDNPEPLKYLEGSFALGSVVIITTRYEDLLDKIEVKAKYKVNQMDEDESLRLFTQYAFGKDRIPDTFTELSKKVLKHAGGLPLALRVFGSTLHKESENKWEWRGYEIDGGYSDDVTELGMHDLLQDMGRKIARNNSPHEPGKHSRLWLREDIKTVLKNHKGTDAIHAIICSCDWGDNTENEIVIDAKSFKMMSKLKFLYLNNANLTGSFEQTFEDLRNLETLPDSICSLRALEVLKIGYCISLEALPTELGSIESLKELHAYALSVSKLPDSIGSLTNLVELDLSHNWNLETLQDSICSLRALEVLDISYCTSLEALPTELGSIESLKELHACELSVSKLPDSIGRLSNLVLLDLRFNKNLETLPDSICSLRALEVLNIGYCTRLKALPTELGSIESLKELHACELSVSKLPDSIGRLSNLVLLDLRFNKNLETLPDSICSLRALEVLNIGYCTRLKALPTELGSIESLKELHACELSVSKLPDSIGHLTNLVELDLSHNGNLETLPDIICSLRALTLERLPNPCNLKHLKMLNLTNCSGLTEIQDLEELTTLKDLLLENCTSLERLPNLCNLWFDGDSRLGGTHFFTKTSLGRMQIISSNMHFDKAFL
ncbi:hypothetical protein AgCh_040057 [Apium graveolens]